MSLILSLTIFDGIEAFGVLDRYTTSLLRWLYGRINCTFVSGRIDQQLAQSPFAASNLSRISRISGQSIPVFNVDWVP